MTKHLFLALILGFGLSKLSAQQETITSVRELPVGSKNAYYINNRLPLKQNFLL